MTTATNTGLSLPFAIGDVLWAPTNYPEKRRIPCPICAGTLAVIVVLGSGEEVGVPCEACGLGLNGPQGTVDEWVYEAGATRFEIAGIKSMHAERWWLVSADGCERCFEDLKATEAEALDASRRDIAAQLERYHQSWAHKRRATKQAGWTVRYHRDEIRRLEKQIAWHQGRLLKVDRPKKRSESLPSADAVREDVGDADRDHAR